MEKENDSIGDWTILCICDRKDSLIFIECLSREQSISSIIFTNYMVSSPSSSPSPSSPFSPSSASYALDVGSQPHFEHPSSSASVPMQQEEDRQIPLSSSSSSSFSSCFSSSLKSAYYSFINLPLLHPSATPFPHEAKPLIVRPTAVSQSSSPLPPCPSSVAAPPALPAAAPSVTKLAAILSSPLQTAQSPLTASALPLPTPLQTPPPIPPKAPALDRPAQASSAQGSGSLPSQLFCSLRAIEALICRMKQAHLAAAGIARKSCLLARLRNRSEQWQTASRQPGCISKVS
ncbi:uncharacterized protein MONOS_9147 [Monocercomonoides exilis]|uniref:uncharacterized protein n=1 Tax=Monocercomonoides exilis TaxID=2049356 RepID=UPI0035598C66|nr:hypothetical protein MONOS_9147 [Monocercomonoides exilis]|eukprot:MONOS_9147.1-p1 / transcript=MONOS_9147.1 / gene=MONOS_9147 / organism=Monocercomonoides_exilis_PA203 / gene_product=unspecified product / transcript_product=unspecified product / location=Mono_scaffold00368:48457-49716(-) / protein_length=290 / sequence_SO=supercontig / SO=protein_coding / is_pseudo=false